MQASPDLAYGFMVAYGARGSTVMARVRCTPLHRRLRGEQAGKYKAVANRGYVAIFEYIEVFSAFPKVVPKRVTS